MNRIFGFCLRIAGEIWNMDVSELCRIPHGRPFSSMFWDAFRKQQARLADLIPYTSPSLTPGFEIYYHVLYDRSLQR